ncbi:MAG: hypothetical protein DHS20C21_07190 [Gemmatimonadota bacterium]|nr:MAG: hypothetical protein DHS20C21_07190 [Gemmatimonadota bacterium]
MRHAFLPALLLAALACPAFALDDNPEAPVGVVGLEVFANRTLWKESERVVGATPYPNEVFEQKLVAVGANLIVPTTPYLTIRVGAARTGSTTRDEIVSSGAYVPLKETMQAWSMAASLTFWIGSPAK